MSENETAEVEEVQETPETEGSSEETQSESEPFDAERAKAKIHKTNREAQSLRQQLKAAQDRLAEIDNAKLSESERTQNQIKQLEQRASAAEQKAMRLEVAQTKGLTAAQAKRLVGNSLEELEADADELLEAFAAKEAKKPPTKKPTESLRGGGNPDKEPELSGDKAADLIAKRIRGF